MTMKKVSGDLAKNRDYLDRQLGVGESFDVLYRNVEIGKKNAALYMIDGFCKDEVMQKLLCSILSESRKSRCRRTRQR